MKSCGGYSSDIMARHLAIRTVSERASISLRFAMLEIRRTDALNSSSCGFGSLEVLLHGTPESCFAAPTTISPAPISVETKTTRRPSTAVKAPTCLRRLDLPQPGRAATTINSPG